MLGHLYKLLSVCETGGTYVTATVNEVKDCIAKVEDAIAQPFLTAEYSDVHRRLAEMCCRLNHRDQAIIATCNYDLLIERACMRRRGNMVLRRVCRDSVGDGGTLSLSP